MGLFDSIQATPRNGLLGLLSDTLSGAYDAAGRIPERIDAGRIKGLLNLLGVPAVAATTDRMSYGEPLTNAGKANVPLLRPETADAAMAVAPVAAKWPREVAGSVLGLLGIADTGALSKAATVWHGSPHKFDRFDASKIGTGEGAQAYGHGIYTAESPDVAQAYANKLTVVDGRAISDQLDSRVRYLNMLKQQAAEGDANAAKNVPVIEKSIAELQNQGNLYKVDLPDSAISRMLDWDKPLSQQAPVVQKALGPRVVQRNGGWYVDTGPKQGSWKFASEAEAAAEARQAAMSRDLTGNVLHDSLKTGADADTARMLRELGIPGIRYLDGGSRGAGAGTSNYVVFPGEEGLLRILERNGQTLP